MYYIYSDYSEEKWTSKRVACDNIMESSMLVSLTISRAILTTCPRPVPSPMPKLWRLSGRGLESAMRAEGDASPRFIVRSIPLNIFNVIFHNVQWDLKPS